ncbi:VIT-domain-containing protein [Setomelanomma holmii]|uniref:VIT-domain-containing protein n=1 Tax=Setomelanomma holmii TaxID=210430 RepID=A0A9P4H138_9PLEO|nr:VIT-domain-containing protein [Setomelanomma holmii]
MSLFNSTGYYRPRSAWRDHICGLYYNVTCNGRLQKTYLPQVQLQAHATILATTSRTTLSQTFVNPSKERGIREVRYTFPLYDGVSVVGFTCHVGDRVIVGEVKEKEKARAVFKEAVARGETAGLFEQLPEASDVFTTTVGNIPPDAKVIVEITYLGELKHDMEVDGIRYTIPNVISPRYGNYPGSLRSSSAVDSMGSSISITVDAEMADGSFIQKIQSPTHPISMTMGTMSIAPNADPTMTKASATLTLGTAQLETDFVVQVVAKSTGVPKAVLENHLTIPNHRALMTTLVPKFALPPEKPELVFVCDRSGSMAGSNITLVVQALKVFLKSLPVGVKFNICSFGSSYSFLWPKSVTYSQKTLDEAVRHAEGFSANYGGTEMLTPLKATIGQRYKDLPLDVMLLTDGEIWNQAELFAYLNKSITESKAPIRLFTLGIGNGVSHTLIEGVAKAGNGFSQSVGAGEKMDTKVVRMLKGALSPHVNDYTLEVKYSQNAATTDEEDDFEIVEKVADSLRLKLDIREKEKIKRTISLFDTSADPDKEEPPAYDETGEQRYAHLPNIPKPKIIQAPQNIPSLFAFNRTTAYLLLGPDVPTATPKSVILRGTSVHGPLELEIPIQILDQPGETIHQLAAKKAISELEQGRGWLSDAKEEAGTLIKSKFEGRFEDMVEREAVRLGVQFQVGGKWCSFVAVESNKRAKEEEKEKKESEGWEWLEDESHMQAQLQHQGNMQQRRGGRGGRSASASRSFGSPAPSLFQSTIERGERLDSLSQSSGGFAAQSQAFAKKAKKGNSRLVDFFGSSSPAPAPPSSKPSGGLFGGGGLFGSSKPSSAFGSNSNAGPQQPTLFSAGPATSAGPTGASLFGNAQSQSAGSGGAPQGAGLFGNAPATSGGFGNAPPAASPSPAFGSVEHAKQLQDYQMGLMMLHQDNPKRKLMARQQPADLGGFTLPPPQAAYAPSEPSARAFAPGKLFSAPTAPTPSNKTPEDLSMYLISLQKFEGSWEASAALFAALQIQSKAAKDECTKAGVDAKVFVTALVIAVFEKKLSAFEGSWELVVEKARGWLNGLGVSDVEGLIGKAGVLVK